ncbi:MAG: sugar phosphate isomerase/epimerase [Planctomycetes bacterium]|nr:sugar phosphate isomerase/epimerase [Planctomycetota bacterium]
MKKISIGSWAYTIGPYATKPVDFDTVCRKLVELGFDGVELGGFAPHPNPDDLPERSQREDVRAKMKELGLGFSGLAANLWGEKLINTDDTTHYVEEFTKNAAFCRDLGIAGIRVDTVQPPTVFAEVDPDTAFQRVTSTWRACCDIAADHGLYVTWEFEPGFAFNKPSDVIRILEGVSKDNFGVLYDTSHGHMCAVVGARQPGAKETLAGGQVEFVRALSGKINHIHLIDSDNTCHKDVDGNDETSMHLPFGKGVVAFDPIVAELAKQEVSHDWWTIDLCFWPDAWEATASCKAFMDAQNAAGAFG